MLRELPAGGGQSHLYTTQGFIFARGFVALDGGTSSLICSPLCTLRCPLHASVLVCCSLSAESPSAAMQGKYPATPWSVEDFIACSSHPAESATRTPSSTPVCTIVCCPCLIWTPRSPGRWKTSSRASPRPRAAHVQHLPTSHPLDGLRLCLGALLHEHRRQQVLLL